MKAKVNVLAKSYPYIFITLQLVHESYLVAIWYLPTRHTYLYNWCNAYATRS